MTTLTRTDIQRMAVSAIGALFVSATCIAAAVLPAKAAALGARPVAGSEHGALACSGTVQLLRY